MTKTHPNQGAFASMSQFNKQTGLTKREYFAAMAMQGLLANTKNSFYERVANDALDAADALINALNKEQ